MEQIDVMHLARTIQTEADAYAYLEGLRWNGKPVCSHCGNDERIYFPNPANGTSRKTRTGAKSQRRVWKCGACRKQFSVLTGTIFHGTKVSVHTWLMVIFGSRKGKYGAGGRADLPPKTIVVSLVDEAGEMRSKIIPDITGATLRKAIAE